MARPKFCCDNCGIGLKPVPFSMVENPGQANYMRKTRQFCSRNCIAQFYLGL